MDAETTAELIDAVEVARRLNTTKRTVQKLVRRGAIPVVKLSPWLWRFSWPAVVEALAAKQEQATD